MILANGVLPSGAPACSTYVTCTYGKTKVVKKKDVKEFLITIIHEIRHAMDAKKYGWRKFKNMYEYEMNYQISQGKDEYKDNKYEIEAEEFGQKNWQKWYKIFNLSRLQNLLISRRLYSTVNL